MNATAGIAIIKAKAFLHKFKSLISPAEQKKRTLKAKMEPYRKEIVNQLYELGFSHIRDYSVSTWKYYGIDQIRITVIACKQGENKKKFIIKVTKGFEDKVNNSIRFQKEFNDVFGFIPKGFEIPLTGYVGYATEYINSYPFGWAKYFVNTSNVDNYLDQAKSILDALSQYGIVHCDLESVNLLVSKKGHRLYIIDWDTCCSDKMGLSCERFPAYTIKRKTDNNKYIYDDAYSFCTLFRRLNIRDLEEKEKFIRLKKMIGVNVHVADE